MIAEGTALFAGFLTMCTFVDEIGLPGLMVGHWSTLTLYFLSGWLARKYPGIDFLAHCANHNESQRAEMLLGYLSNHEMELARVINGFDKNGETNALDTWCCEYLKKQPIVQHRHCDAPYADLDAQQIMEVIVHLHEQVIDLYGFLYSRAITPSAMELLGNLRLLEENHAKQLSRVANQLEDIGFPLNQ